MARAAGRRDRGAVLAAFAACALALPVDAGAQAAAAGRVVRPGASDTTPVAGVRVVLHRIGADAQGPIDSLVSGQGGRFRFRFSPDTGAIYLLSARYRGIEYFSQPVSAGAARPDTGLSLLVHDTSSSAPVRLGARHVIIPRAGDDGTRDALDLVILRNESHLARVAPDSVGASWAMPLPPGSEGLEVGESDVSSETVSRRGDSLYLGAPIGPGEKQLSLQYHLPPGMSVVAVPVGATGGPVNVLVEEPGASVTGPGIAPADSQVVLGRLFRRWSGEVPAGGLIRVRLPGPGEDSTLVLGLLVAGVALGLGVAAWQIGRRRATPRAAPFVPGQAEPADEREALLSRIARLDATYAGREGEVRAEEWQGYLEQRARLKAALESALAANRARG
ncbi:MAG TPA: hypothetical protein VMN37_04645 [Gemmatimonadales bacterium]|nr:hypothetical protein [Gemmatimonadales bacterium]